MNYKSVHRSSWLVSLNFYTLVLTCFLSLKRSVEIWNNIERFFFLFLLRGSPICGSVQTKLVFNLSRFTFRRSHRSVYESFLSKSSYFRKVKHLDEHRSPNLKIQQRSSVQHLFEIFVSCEKCLKVERRQIMRLNFSETFQNETDIPIRGEVHQ